MACLRRFCLALAVPGAQLLPRWTLSKHSEHQVSGQES